MREENSGFGGDKCREDNLFRTEPPLRGVPVVTFILMLIFSAGAAVFARSGPYDGWLWLVISAGLAAYADFISGSRLSLLAPVFGTIVSAAAFYPCVPLWPIAAAFLGYFISAASRGRMARNTSIVLSSAVLIIFAGLHFAAQSALAGDLSISGTISQAVAPYVQMKQIIIENKELLVQSGINTDPEVLITAIRDELVRSSPATVVICALLISWLSSAFMNILSRFFTPSAYICGRKTTMSASSAIVFIASYLIVLLFGSNVNSAIVLASENISMMLLPGFFIVGITELTAVLKAKVSGISFGFYVVVVIITLLMSMGGAAVLYAAYGVFSILRARHLEKIADKDSEL